MIEVGGGSPLLTFFPSGLWPFFPLRIDPPAQYSLLAATVVLRSPAVDFPVIDSGLRFLLSHLFFPTSSLLFEMLGETISFSPQEKSVTCDNTDRFAIPSFLPSTLSVTVFAWTIPPEIE